MLTTLNKKYCLPKRKYIPSEKNRFNLHEKTNTVKSTMKYIFMDGKIDQIQLNCLFETLHINGYFHIVSITR